MGWEGASGVRLILLPRIVHEIQRRRLAESDDYKTVQLDWAEPTVPAVYATNIVIQQTQHEFMLLFYMARPAPDRRRKRGGAEG